MSTDITRHNCIVLGVEAKPEYLRADGDILFATPANRVLFSDGKVFLNDELVSESGEEVMVAIRDTMVGIQLCMLGGYPAKAPVKTMISLMGRMTDDERMEIMSGFCHHCGGDNPQCRCWDDT